MAWLCLKILTYAMCVPLKTIRWHIQLGSLMFVHVKTRECHEITVGSEKSSFFQDSVGKIEKLNILYGKEHFEILVLELIVNVLKTNTHAMRQISIQSLRIYWNLRNDNFRLRYTVSSWHSRFNYNMFNCRADDNSIGFIRKLLRNFAPENKLLTWSGNNLFSC